jgi:hypothetical protein
MFFYFYFFFYFVFILKVLNPNLVVFEYFTKEFVIDLIIEILNISILPSLPISYHFVNKSLLFKSNSDSLNYSGLDLEKVLKHSPSKGKEITFPSILEVQYNLMVFLYIFTKSLSSSSKDGVINLIIPLLLNLFKLYYEYFQKNKQKYFGAVFNLSLLVLLNISNRGFVLPNSSSNLNLYKDVFEKNEGFDILYNLFNYFNSSYSSSSSSSSQSYYLFKSSLTPYINSFLLKSFPNPSVLLTGLSSENNSLFNLNPSSKEISEIETHTILLVLLSFLSIFRNSDVPSRFSSLVLFAKSTSNSPKYSSFKPSSSDSIQITLKNVLDVVKNIKQILKKK